MGMEYDEIAVGHGLSGLVAASELAEAGKKVLLLDQEPAANLGGQAHWSFGGLFLVDSPEQRRLRRPSSHDLALQDWLGPAGFHRWRRGGAAPDSQRRGRITGRDSGRQGMRRGPPVRSGPALIKQRSFVSVT